jgi:hypothetical protein
MEAQLEIIETHPVIVEAHLRIPYSQLRAVEAEEISFLVFKIY